MCDLTVVGWMSTRMKARLACCDALQMAVWQRQPQVGLLPPPSSAL
ncbi:hypothetical protein [Nitrosomonas sp. GH22]|nr:hypothetical protein [Nitrosomonas sp. GH22]